MAKSCSHCYYCEQCRQDEVCEYYHPVGEEAEEERLVEMIEKARIEYRSAWLDYIDEDI